MHLIKITQKKKRKNTILTDNVCCFDQHRHIADPLPSVANIMAWRKDSQGLATCPASCTFMIEGIHSRRMGANLHDGSAEKKKMRDGTIRSAGAGIFIRQ